MALQAYRHLLRATRITFAGDERVLIEARDRIRSGFREKASLSPTDPAVQPALQHAHELAEFLKANVVQGRNEGEDRYRLRIHEHTERGDNDTVKVAGGKTVKIGGGCCSS
ncbi:Mitochondrial zinc maintenance protein 1, mitochondrial [Cytospora mali]|uniref:Mitochondrial zinc maintenance protein 1, mitochondrial n=1 Tax=Cytospora mali TaxID=578113 RepID=A0A194VY47_CYTMA|nr:Mitochondrial zinc maintenance protein 1, mitochondrial [Valsa mali]